MKRLAFTLIELIVVLALMALLLALLIPAIQKVRSAAQRMQCGSQLRQMGLALHQYHDVADGFPPGMTLASEPKPYLSWIPRLLPYLDQGNLWQQAEEDFRAYPNPLRSDAHRAIGKVIPLLTCPADPRRHLSVPVHNPDWSGPDLYRAAFTSYVGVSGVNRLSFTGLFSTDSRVHINQITDGTSQTLCVGERPPDATLRVSWWYAGAGDDERGTTEHFLGVEEIHLPGKRLGVGCPRGPYSFRPGRMEEICSFLHFWSLHDGGGYFLMADGSTHFIRYHRSRVLAALATRAGGEVASVDD